MNTCIVEMQGLNIRWEMEKAIFAKVYRGFPFSPSGTCRNIISDRPRLLLLKLSFIDRDTIDTTG
jgi:hypothetical protein